MLFYTAVVVVLPTQGGASLTMLHNNDLFPVEHLQTSLGFSVLAIILTVNYCIIFSLSVCGR